MVVKITIEMRTPYSWSSSQDFSIEGSYENACLLVELRNLQGHWLTPCQAYKKKLGLLSFVTLVFIGNQVSGKHIPNIPTILTPATWTTLKNFFLPNPIGMLHMNLH